MDSFERVQNVFFMSEKVCLFTVMNADGSGVEVLGCT